MSGRRAPHWLTPLGTVAVIVLAAAIWKWSPLADYLNARQWLTLTVNPVGGATMATILGAYLLGGLLFVPLSAMVAVTFVVLPDWGLAYSLTGAAANASVTYLVGRWLGLRWLRRTLGGRADRLARRLRRRGVVALLTVRLVPVAPFTVVNLVTGACGVRYREYLAGTILGMLPGLLALHFVTRGALGASTAADLVAALVAAAALIAATAWAARRSRKGRGKDTSSDGSVSDEASPLAQG